MVWIILFFLLLFFTWLLWTPLFIEVDSIRGVYRVDWQGIAGVGWSPEADPTVLRLRIFWWRRRIDLATRPDVTPTTPDQKKRTRPKQKGKRRRMPIFRIVRNVLSSFRVRKGLIWWDTDDFSRNATLYPLSVYTWSRKIKVIINFEGRNDVVLVLQNSLGRLIWAFGKSFI
jgi:hypothetical protein